MSHLATWARALRHEHDAAKGGVVFKVVVEADEVSVGPIRASSVERGPPPDLVPDTHTLSLSNLPKEQRISNKLARNPVARQIVRRRSADADEQKTPEL